MPALAAAQRGSASLRCLTGTLSQLTLRTSSASSSRRAPLSSSTPATPSQLSCRSFSSTPAALTKTISLQRIPSDPVPEYPYGPRLLYKQSNNGLYGTLRPRTGNNVSSDHKVRTARTWRPNIHRKKLWSAALGAWVRTRLSLRVLRTIRKEGGLDAYVLGSKASRIKELGPGGWKLRWLVMQTRAVRDKFDQQRETLGVDRALLEAAAETDPALVIDKDELVEIMMDSATPGPLSAKSRRAIENRAMQLAAAQMAKEVVEEEFALGHEAAELPGEMIAEEEAEAEEVKKP